MSNSDAFNKLEKENKELKEHLKYFNATELAEMVINIGELQLENKSLKGIKKAMEYFSTLRKQKLDLPLFDDTKALQVLADHVEGKAREALDG